MGLDGFVYRRVNISFSLLVGSTKEIVLYYDLFAKDRHCRWGRFANIRIQEKDTCVFC